ncbi:hypothetical protein B0H65DRAFT_87148 [Neurospora tetraspora]|uniref:Uncharacterized protein n=1 Tax=Neurospora tetraspora TaxID=94610 RepID=A0AAE0JJC8_9PEZI|nr:hypothetical protein B0H65DRAFT_87148 [Neurospora tetraspora]
MVWSLQSLGAAPDTSLLPIPLSLPGTVFIAKVSVVARKCKHIQDLPSRRRRSPHPHTLFSLRSARSNLHPLQNLPSRRRRSPYPHTLFSLRSARPPAPSKRLSEEYQSNNSVLSSLAVYNADLIPNVSSSYQNLDTFPRLALIAPLSTDHHIEHKSIRPRRPIFR